MTGMLIDPQRAWMGAMMAKVFDQSLPLERNTADTDTSGHATENWSSLGLLSCLIKNPTATMLTLYAEVIGSQRSVVVEAAANAGVKQGDRVTYDGHQWLIHEVKNAESYSFTNDYLAVVIV